MALQRYLNHLKEVIDSYIATHIILESSIRFDVRPGEQGYVKGSIRFKDGSVLHFTEFIDVVGEVTEKIMYTYHYQDKDQGMVFRYDNARHQPSLTFLNHKHVRDTVLETSPRVVESVLAEICTQNGWL